MSVATVRILASDPEQFDRYTITGTGELDFQLPHFPVVDGSQSVTVGGVAKTEGADYTINNGTGVISFTVVPDLVVATYRYTLLSDADIQTILTLEGDSDYMAAAQCLEVIAASQVLILKVISAMDIKTDGAAVAKSLMDRAKSLRERALASDLETGAGFDWAEQVPNDFAFRERVRNEAIREG
jgi:hypothetical protein